MVALLSRAALRSNHPSAAIPPLKAAMRPSDPIGSAPMVAPRWALI